MSQRVDLKVFIASTSELTKERMESVMAITELNKNFPHLHLEPILFELDTSSGSNPGIPRIQDGINALLDKSDIIVTLFYSYIGQFTKEEFDRASKQGKKVFLYLKEGFQSDEAELIERYLEVITLRKTIEAESNVRYQKFDSNNYNGLLYKDLAKYISEYHPNKEVIKEDLEKNGGQKAVDLKNSLDEDNDDDIANAVRLLLEKGKDISYNSSEEDLKNVRNLREKILEKFSFIQDRIDNIPQLIDVATSDLFKNIYSSETLSISIREEIVNIRSNEKYQWHHRSLIISALTVSLLTHKKVDQNKILLLIDFVTDMEPNVWKKALTGLALSLTYRKNGWLKFSMVIKRLELLKQNSEIQRSLQLIAFIIDTSLYKVYNVGSSIVDLDFFKQSPSNYFMPFYENNPAIEHFMLNSSSGDASHEIELISNSPLPDFIKYLICYNNKNSESKKNTPPRKVLNYVKYLNNVSRAFEPFLQYLSELYVFINYYPQDRKEEVFTKELSMASVKLKDHVLEEKERHIIQGIHYYRVNDFSNAINHLNLALKYSENDIEVLSNLANCYNSLKRFDDELTIRYRIEGIEPKSIDNIFSIAYILNKIKNAIECNVYCNKALEINSTHSPTLILLAETKMHQRRISEALHYCNVVIQKESDNYDAYRIRGLAYKAISENKLALKDFEKLIELAPKKAEGHVYIFSILSNNKGIGVVNEEIERLYGIFQNNNDLLRFHAAFLVEIGSFEKALELIDKIISNDKKNRSFYDLRSMAYDLLNEKDKALKDITSYMSLYRLDVDAYVSRSNIYSDLGMFEESEKDLKAAIEILNKYDNENFLLRGTVLAKQKKYDEALIQYEIALEKNNEDFEACICLAQLYKLKNKFEIAIEKLVIAKKIAPNKARIYSLLADLYIEIKDNDKAIDNLSKTIELSPNNVGFYYDRIDYYKKIKLYEQAISDCKMTLELNPTSTTSITKMADIYNLNRDFDKALSTINIIFTENYPITDPFTYGTLAEIYYNLNRKEDFLNSLERALKDGLEMDSLDEDILSRCKNDDSFISLINKFNKVLN